MNAKSAESDDKDLYFPGFSTSMLEVLDLGGQTEELVELLNLRKEKMDGAFRMCLDVA